MGGKPASLLVWCNRAGAAQRAPSEGRMLAALVLQKKNTELIPEGLHYNPMDVK